MLLIVLIVATIGGFAFFKPKPAQAIFGIGDTVFNPYDDFIRPIIVSTLRTMYLGAVRPQLANIIAGKSDRPIYVPNAAEYLRDVFTDEVAKQIEEISGINVCEPFKAQLVIALGANFARLPYERPPAPECTAERAWKNIEEGVASLDDFVVISQPQNNIFGAYLIASDNMERIIGRKLEYENTQLVTGQGFIGVRATRIRDGKEEEYVKTPGAIVYKMVTDTDRSPLEIIQNSKDVASLFTGIAYDLITVATGGLTERFYRSAMNYYESKR